MSRAPAIAPVCGALGGVGQHIIPPLLVLLSDCVVMFGVGCAHHVELLVLHLEVTVATSLVHMSLVLDASSLQELGRTGRTEEWTEAQSGRGGGGGERWWRGESNGALHY